MSVNALGHVGSVRTITKRFFTEDGIEVPGVTAEQMRVLDRIAMEETGPNLFQMMENAGRNLASLTIEVLGDEWTTAAVVVLAGSGGNGGGGICAARHLANRGVRVTLCLAAPDRLEDVTAFQRRIFQHTPGKEVAVASLPKEPVDFILDGLIGYSLHGAPRGTVVELIQWANEAEVPILALDLPSGVDATTGQVPGEFVEARWTMTLALPKTGLAPQTAGDLFLADIGIPEGAYRRLGVPFVAPFGSRFRIPLVCR